MWSGPWCVNWCLCGAAIVYSGWRGTVFNLLQAALRVLCWLVGSDGGYAPCKQILCLFDAGVKLKSPRVEYSTRGVYNPLCGWQGRVLCIESN